MEARKTSRRTKHMADDKNKKTQKKRRLSGEGPSGSDEAAVQLRDVQLSDSERDRFYEFQTKFIGDVLYFDYSTLGRFGLMSRITPLILRPDWEKFFNIRECTLTPITFEVLATLSVGRIRNWTDKVIKFQAFGKKHELSANDLGVKMGFYRPRETRTPEFHELLDSYTSIPAAEFWNELTQSGEPYHASVSKGTALCEPEYKVMHHMLAHTVTGRMGSPGVVNTTDLLCLWSMLKGVRIHMGVLMAGMLQAHASTKIMAIYVGPYITHLLKGMGYGQQLDEEKVLASMKSFHSEKLESLGFRQVRRGSDDEDIEEGQERAPTPPPQWSRDPRVRLPRRPQPQPQSEPAPSAGWEHMRDQVFQRFDTMELNIMARMDTMEANVKEHVSQQLDPLNVRLTAVETQWNAFYAQYPYPQGPSFPPQDP